MGSAFQVTFRQKRKVAFNCKNSWSAVTNQYHTVGSISAEPAVPYCLNMWSTTEAAAPRPPLHPNVLLFVTFCVFFLSLQVTLVTNVQLDSPWICPVHTVGVSCFSISLEISIKIEFFLLHIWV